MKKLYTLLMAVAVTLSAAAAMPFQAKKANELKVADMKMEVSKTERHATIDINKLNVPADKLIKRSAISRADEYPSFDREYFLMSYSDNTYTELDANMCHLYDDPEVPGAGLYYLEDFIMPGTNQIECSFEFYQLEDGSEVLVLVIPGKGQTPLFTQNGQTYSLYLMGYEDESPALYTNDLEFLLLNDGTLMFAYSDAGIAYINSQTMRGNWVFNPNMVLPNGTFDADIANDIDEESGQLIGSHVTCPIYAEYYEEEQVMMIANMAEYGRTAIYSVDTTQKLAQAPSQPVVTLYTQTATFDGILSSALDAETPVTMTLSNEDGKTMVSCEECYIIVPPTEALGNSQYMWYNVLLDTKMVLNFDILGTSTESGVAEVEFDANAPVEYYNLQGVRVDNPTSGLYIKRQGNKAAKVFVK